MIRKFDGPYGFLSNFYPSPVSYKWVTYPTVEHAYQAAKTLDTLERHCILNQLSPVKAKQLGKRVHLRPDWDNIKLGIMEELIRQKFTDPTLKAKLLATEDQILVEGNWWNDTFWGEYKGIGSNHLGKILMKVREELNDSNI